MLQAALAVLLAFPASTPASQGSPCERTRLGPVGVTAFAGSRRTELDVQRDCLAWEATVQPRAEFLPPSRSSAPGTFALQPAAPGFPRPRPGAILKSAEPDIPSFGPGLEALVPAGSTPPPETPTDQ
jgi:hypothetical protein